MSNIFHSPVSVNILLTPPGFWGEQVLRMAVSLFVGIYVARYLGPERFGLLSYALSFVQKAIISIQLFDD